MLLTAIAAVSLRPASAARAERCQHHWLLLTPAAASEQQLDPEVAGVAPVDLGVEAHLFSLVRFSVIC